MTQKELKALYKSHCDEGDFEESVQEYRDALDGMGADLISYDWKGGGEGAEKFIGYLKGRGYTVLEDPYYEGSDTYGWVIFPPG